MRGMLVWFVLVLVALSITASAWSSGPPASNVVSGDGCVCHNGTPNAGTVVTVEAPNTYATGQKYSIRVTSTTDVVNAGINKGGFLSWVSAGTFSKAAENPTWYQTETLDGKSVIKHTSSGDQSNTNQEWRYDWTAPSTLVGAVTLKVWVNRVNGDGSASSADHWNRKHTTIEGPAATTTSATSATTKTTPTSTVGGTTTPKAEDPSIGVPLVLAVIAIVVVSARRD